MKKVQIEVYRAYAMEGADIGEVAKKPILQQIFKDKTHHCWADAAWILDVTGELPKAK